jgi:hypothetical protein
VSEAALARGLTLPRTDRHMRARRIELRQHFNPLPPLTERAKLATTLMGIIAVCRRNATTARLAAHTTRSGAGAHAGSPPGPSASRCANCRPHANRSALSHCIKAAAQACPSESLARTPAAPPIPSAYERHRAPHTSALIDVETASLLHMRCCPMPLTANVRFSNRPVGVNAWDGVAAASG